MNKTILVTTSSFGNNSDRVVNPLAERGYTLVTNPYKRKLTEDELMMLLDQYKPVGLLAGTESISYKVLENARSYLKVISRVGVGWDNVDRRAAQRFGIKVYRTQGILKEAVAELTIAFIISALRFISSQDRNLRRGYWQKNMGRLFKGKTLGIIGFGAIGQEVGRLARAFHAEIIYYDIYDIKVDWAKRVGLEELLRLSDIITLHVSGSEQILGEMELNSICKNGTIVINTSRGGIIDEYALYKALKTGNVAYACLDVFGCEPYSGPLTELDNVLLTPHIGSYALEARVAMEQKAVENLLHGLGEDHHNIYFEPNG